MSSTYAPGDPIRVTVQRFDPVNDAEPTYTTYRVPYTRGMRVLEALDYIVEELGESLAYQWFCGVKKCGTCGVQVNGRPGLSCYVPAEDEMVIEPLAGFPVMRDLVIDRSEYETALASIQPWLQRGTPYTSFPEDVSSSSMQVTSELQHCIECLLCSSACRSKKGESAQGVKGGTAVLVQLARYATDPRDDADRTALALEAGIEHACDSDCDCVNVCPVGINIKEHAIRPLRELVSRSSPRAR